jgi:hypothetical protein
MRFKGRKPSSTAGASSPLAPLALATRALVRTPPGPRLMLPRPRCRRKSLPATAMPAARGAACAAGAAGGRRSAAGLLPTPLLLPAPLLGSTLSAVLAASRTLPDNAWQGRTQLLFAVGLELQGRPVMPAHGEAVACMTSLLDRNATQPQGKGPLNRLTPREGKAWTFGHLVIACLKFVNERRECGNLVQQVHASPSGPRTSGRCHHDARWRPPLPHPLLACMFVCARVSHRLSRVQFTGRSLL